MNKMNWKRGSPCTPAESIAAEITGNVMALSLHPQSEKKPKTQDCLTAAKTQKTCQRY